MDKEKLYEEAGEVYRDCCLGNWDGYGADKIAEETFELSYSIISLLPDYFPKPEIGPDPYGEISFEWHIRKYKTFLFTIDSVGIITYVGLFGKSKISGTEYFDNQIPEIIIWCLKRMYKK